MSSSKRSNLVPMLKARGINIYELLERSDISLAYMGLIDNGSIKLSKKLAKEIDLMMGEPTGSFHNEFLKERS